MRTFSRPGFITVTVTDGEIDAILANPPADCPYAPAQLNELSAAHYVAAKIWACEAQEKGAALNLRADEYARQARRGLVAQQLEKNALAYAARPDTQGFCGRNTAAALLRRAARAAANC